VSANVYFNTGAVDISRIHMPFQEYAFLLVSSIDLNSSCWGFFFCVCPPVITIVVVSVCNDLRRDVVVHFVNTGIKC